MSAYKFKSEHKSANFRGKFCTLCNSVWELIPSVGIVKHPDFPSFGLERQDCSSCKRISTETNIPSTLAEKAADQRNNLFKKEVERFNKEIERYNK